MYAIKQALQEVDSNTRVCVYEGNKSGDGIVSFLRCLAMMKPTTKLNHVYNVQSREVSKDEMEWDETVTKVICLGCLPVDDVPGVFYVGPPCKRRCVAKFEMENAAMFRLIDIMDGAGSGIRVSLVVYDMVERAELGHLEVDLHARIWTEMLTLIGRDLFVWMQDLDVRHFIEDIVVENLTVVVTDKVDMCVSDALLFFMKTETYLALEDKYLKDDTLE